MSERMKFEIESDIPDESIHERRQEIQRSLIAHIDSIIDDERYFVGEGSIAKVVTVDIPGKETPVCVKYIDSSRTRGTINYAIRGGDTPEYNSPEREAKFLEDLRDIDPDVRVPEPYYYGQKSFKERGSERLKSFLAMEKLNAVTLQAIIQEEEPLPASFDIESFFEKLGRFVENMHKKGIHHHDIQPGNTMIDKATGNPRVIDFGAATYAVEEPKGVSVSDKSGVVQLRIELEEFLTRKANSL